MYGGQSSILYKENYMDYIKDLFGGFGWLIIAFAAGAVLGVPTWNWIKARLPWNK